ncbi:hypothetical protein Tco_1579385, partial [Tanacetum coccineum]
DKERRNALSISKLKAAYCPYFGLEELIPSQWIESKWDTILVQPMVSHTGGLSERNSTSQDIIPPLIAVYYTYLKEIVLHRAYYKEYKISEDDFKNLHPNDFEDLYLLHLQGKLNHLSGDEKVHLYNAVNLWIRNIVIRKCVEDLQLRIESYQTKLNLTQPNWDASEFLFKEDYTIVSKPRVVIYRDRNDQKTMMRECEVHKFVGNGYLRKGQKRNQNDKTKHENGKEREKSKSQSQSLPSQGQRRSRYRRNVKWANSYPSNGPGQPIKTLFKPKAL